MPTDPHRESSKRQHRTLGHYLAIQAWIRRLDCIVLTRGDLESFLGLERFKSSRVAWLQEDLKPWFPHQVPYYKTGATSSIHSLFLSRVDIQPYLPKGSMTTDKRITRIDPTAPKTEKFIREGSPWKPPLEQDIVAQLAVISTGLAVPQDYPAKRRIEAK